MTTVLDLEAARGARAFVRDDTVHLRNRLTGDVWCGATEGVNDEGEAIQALADGPTPEEAGLSADHSEWEWCPECRTLAEAAGVIAEIADDAPEQG